MSKKGPQFERDFSRQLSLWFTNGQEDSIFWRSQNSGGRATTRSKQMKKTMGQYGDIAATDPRGLELIRLLIFELKNGYIDQTVQSVLDAKTSDYREWIDKTQNTLKESGATSWLIIHHRNRRKTILWIPYELYEMLEFTETYDAPVITLWYTSELSIIGMPLDDFFRLVEPHSLMKALKDLERWNRLSKKKSK